MMQIVDICVAYRIVEFQLYMCYKANNYSVSFDGFDRDTGLWKIWPHTFYNPVSLSNAVSYLNIERIRI